MSNPTRKFRRQVAIASLLAAGGMALGAGTAAAQSDDGAAPQDHEEWCDYEVTAQETLAVRDAPAYDAHVQYYLDGGDVVKVREPLQGEDTTFRDLDYSAGVPQWANGDYLEKVDDGECEIK